jgi:predicted secreted protein
LEKLENEGILLLSMSEIMRLKTHMANTNIAQGDLNSRLNTVANENEKNQLIQEIYKLRDLLSDIKNLNNLCTSVEESDWRSGILRAISNIFLNQKEYLLAELRSFISNNGYMQQKDYINYLETKIDDLVKKF